MLLDVGTPLRTPTEREEGDMPKVDPKTGEPVSDEPEQADDSTRGGKRPGDPDLDNATETGGATKQQPNQNNQRPRSARRQHGVASAEREGFEPSKGVIPP